MLYEIEKGVLLNDTPNHHLKFVFDMEIGDSFAYKADDHTVWPYLRYVMRQTDFVFTTRRDKYDINVRRAWRVEPQGHDWDLDLDKTFLKWGERNPLVNRTLTCFQMDNLCTIGDLTSRTEEDLRSIPNFGNKCLDLTRTVLEASGYSLLES